MVGLLQIMIYLFCIYLIYKGCEIFQTAFVSNPKNPSSRIFGMVLGGIGICAAIAISIFAIIMTDGVIERIGNNLPTR